jgi:hypothetical protein
MPGSIRDRISAFEDLANTSLTTGQLMPIVPPSPGFSYTKKFEKLGVRAKETSRIVPFEYKRNVKVRDEIEECRDEKNELDGKENSSEIDDAPRESSSDIMLKENLGHQNADSEFVDMVMLDSEHSSHQVSKDLKSEKEHSEIDNNDDPSSDVIVSGSKEMDGLIEMPNEETACDLQKALNDNGIEEDIDDISFGEYVSAEADEDLNCDSRSFEDKGNDVNNFVSKEDVEGDETFIGEPIIASKTSHVENNVLSLNNGDQGEEKDEMDETEHLEKISRQHLAIFDEDTIEENQYHSESATLDNDNLEMVEEDEMSDLLGVYIDDESITSDHQERIFVRNQSSIRPKARHFHFDDPVSTSHLSAIKETISELEKDDYGPRKVMTPTMQGSEENYEDYGVRPNISNNDDVVSQITEGSLDLHHSHVDKKWRTSLDDHKPCSISEHSSIMTYNLSNQEEESIMEPRHDSAQIFRHRNSLTYSQMKYGTYNEKITGSESTISEITNPTYDKNNSSGLNTISGSDMFEEKNTEHKCKSKDANSDKSVNINGGNSLDDVTVTNSRRSRSRTPQDYERSSHSRNGNRQKNRFSIRGLSPFRRRNSAKSMPHYDPSDNVFSERKEGERVQNDQKTHKKSFSIRSLSPFRRMPKEEKKVSIRVHKSTRNRSPFRRPMNTPSEILQYDEESRNSIPLLAVASNETSTITKAKKEKFSFRSLSPFRRGKDRSQRKARADPFDEGDNSV